MNNLKKAILPVVIGMLGIGTAYAHQVEKEARSTTIQGYLFRPNEAIPCQAVSKMCDNAGSYECTVAGPGTESLHYISGTSCPDVLRNSVPN
ncbi:DUF6520 family protein [Chryseobacterium sp. FH1]|uniref:DUF6520 family protein n=1 Tax=Chryseobacterium sp. FH1 TaxID=1233951 RepID=UPI0004E37C8A|nr:DUF6520 family protein [Chryseobacterium sp. FH1]KFC19324.1 hypothetical protein IO90_08425 [Chryseobacterium sp. FH1]